MKKITLILMLLATPAYAAGPTLNHCSFTWAAPPEPGNDLASFSVYIGTTQGGPYPTKIGTVPATNPAGGQSYGPTANFCASQSDGQKYAVVKALDTAGNESGPSNEIPFALNVVAPVAPINGGVQ